jgi:twitching motility protein PilT
MSRLNEFLEQGRARGASDVHLAPGMPPLLRIHGKLVQLEVPPLGEKDVRHLIEAILTSDQQEMLQGGHDIDLAYDSDGLGRFRVNLFRKIGGLGASFRIVPSQPPKLELLGLPPIVERFLENRQGLLLVTGAAGTGKSTTLASLVDALNRREKLNIITIEDPIEYLHKSKECLVIQREVGTHVPSFAVGLRATLREDPDVILVGELRDFETISLAMTAAETGHLVLSTLHTSSATKTLDRILDSVPAQQKRQAALFLSQHLLGIVSQTLVQTADGSGRLAAVEILVNTPAISNLILQRRIFQVPDQLQTGRNLGMQLMDQVLLEGVKSGRFDPNDVYLQAHDKKAFQGYVTDPSVLPHLSMGGR